LALENTAYLFLPKPFFWNVSRELMNLRKRIRKKKGKAKMIVVSERYIPYSISSMERK